jgi:hypothetical protein
VTDAWAAQHAHQPDAPNGFRSKLRPWPAQVMRNNVRHAWGVGGMKGRVGTCVYCGNTRRLTKDHVPPKALWASPRPSDLVLVPACGECNGAASKDDEYFKMMLVMKAGSGEHPEIKALGPSVMRALSRPEKVGLRKHLQKSIQLEDLRSKAGLYLGRVPVMDVNLQRLDRVIARVTRGLYWHHFGERLRTDCAVAVFSESGLSALGVDEWAQVHGITGSLLASEEHRIGRDGVRYWYSMTEVPQAGAWLFEFFKDVRFLALTMPKSALADV